MAGERLIASYLMRVTVRDGERRIALHHIGRGLHRHFGTYGELAEYLEAWEDAGGEDPGGKSVAEPE